MSLIVLWTGQTVDSWWQPVRLVVREQWSPLPAGRFDADNVQQTAAPTEVELTALRDLEARTALAHGRYTGKRDA